jgi:hypothetical protein
MPYNTYVILRYLFSRNRLTLAIKNENVFLINLFLLTHLLRFRLPKTYQTYYYFGVLLKPIRAYLRFVYNLKTKTPKPHQDFSTFDDIFRAGSTLKPIANGKIKIAFLITHISLVEHQLALIRQISNLEVEILIVDATNTKDDLSFMELRLVFQGLRVVLFQKNIFDDYDGIVVLQYPYLRFVRELIDFDRTQTIVLGYGPNICSSSVYRGSLNTEFCFPLYFKTSLFGVLNNLEKDKFLKSGHVSEKILVSGDPLAWDVVHSPAFRSDVDSAEVFLFDVLWAPHHSKMSHFEDRSGYSNFERDIFYILDLATLKPLKFLIRPHSLLLEALNVGSYNLDVSLAWNKLKSLENVSVSSDYSMIGDLHKSKILVTDGISIIVYGMLMRRDVILSVSDHSPGFNEIYDEALNFHGRYSNLSELKYFLDLALQNSPQESNYSLQELLIDENCSPGEKLVQRILKGGI